MIKKRTRQFEDSPVQLKKVPAVSNDRYDIWRSLDRIRRSYKSAEIPIKRSVIFIPCCPLDREELQKCITKLLQYVDSEKLLMLEIRESFYSNIVVLKNFTVLDFCFVVPVVLATLRRSPLKDADYFRFNPGTNCQGNFYLPFNSLLQLKSEITHVSQVLFPEIMGFKEFHCEKTQNNNVADLINDLFLLISNTKFGKNKDSVVLEFKKGVKLFSKRTTLGVGEINMIEQGLLLNKEDVAQRNMNRIKDSRNKLKDFAETLLKANETTVEPTNANKEAHPATTTPKSSGPQTGAIKSRFRNGTSSSSTSQTATPQTTYSQNFKPKMDRFVSHQHEKPHFMTNDEIKFHCIATIRASIDAVKKMSAYQIVKVYVRYPKKVVEPMFKNLNDLRTKTNCNIIILHYNNEHESVEWLKTLELTRYSKSPQTPNPQTVRIVSIGGVAEYIVSALEEILALLEQSQ
ncbi:56 kDa U1 small nuclear ribonucleoprotein component [Nakaseomyces bracarensis]|uniref:56 kDa U1 small nuclear ribonucleoprotein component n=1 Tax=Nakaseomyces bracarensis TaxID=273131 RepID=A0ABR4NU88_9SACH